MWGYPGEQIEDIAATVDLVKKCLPDIHLTTVAYPIKNTGYFLKAAGSVVSVKDWADSTDRDYRIKGRHSRNYYKQADSWLNNEVAAARVEDQDPGEATRRRAAATQARELMMAVAQETEA
jgi:hypothetical protein